MKAYIVTEQQMQSLRERLELTHMRENNIMREADLNKFEKSDLYRAFNFIVCRWIDEVGRQ